MATTITRYNNLTRDLLDKIIDLEDGTIKVMLLDDTYTFDPTHRDKSDIDATSSEVVGTGYTAGGNALAGKTLTETSGQTVFDATDLTWATLTASFAYAVIYQESTIVDGVTDPLIACISLDGGTEIIITATDYTLIWNVNGIIVVG